ncbi:hypothetical protein RD792_011599 [Penstemon davidsonii]|uniref:Uncharacterized protein n=1 Tax=Penstemon davidsonii TaxID=160366 RepID=A0ABR0CYD4_9LAMI|nr:hypothetical protein RD792_011599 [Penstemon davidsonii]
MDDVWCSNVWYDLERFFPDDGNGSRIMLTSRIRAFPEDTQIPVKKLIWLWIAEGFIQREQDKSPELVAEEYLSDLINRSLILIARKKSGGGIKACSIHDLLRDMCLRKAHEEKVSKSVDDCLSLYEKHHRLFVHSESSADGRPFGLYYRSFSGHLSHPSSNIPQMKLLRVMNLKPNSSSYELKRVDLLVQLRYLAVDRMPKPLVGNFVNLEFLIIDSDKKNFIPLVILKLVKLRHVKIKKYVEFEEDCYNCQTTNLRSLSYIWINNDKDDEILRCSPHLRKLKCFYDYDDTLFPDLHSLTDLQILNLRYLTYFSGELTKVNFPSTIKNLSLSDVGLPWVEMSIIGRLPNLHVLKLSHHAFVGEEWETRDGEFQELRVLELCNNDIIKQWITCSEHFPQLQCLLVSRCINLKEIPSEIGDIPTLQKIRVYDSGYEVYKSAVQIEQDQRENGNEELQVITKNKYKMEELVRGFEEREFKKTVKVADQPDRIVDKELEELIPKEIKLINLYKVAKFIMFKALDEDRFQKIKHPKTAKEMWDKVCELSEGNDAIKEHQLSVALEEFENFKMKSGETIDQMDTRFAKTLNAVLRLGKEFSDK